jgi:SAM-dependent methyltransferase
MRGDTVPLSHFEDLYRREPDPWGFATSGYEAAKYAATLEALPRPCYAKALEVGCSIGVFTALLAERCDDLLALEPVEAALAAARNRNDTRPWVRFAPAFVPADWPSERFDLVVLSEVLDYLGADDLLGVAAALRRTVRQAGDVVLVHWVGKKRGGPASEDEASERLITALAGSFVPLQQSRNPDYRLDVLRRTDAPNPTG